MIKSTRVLIHQTFSTTMSGENFFRVLVFLPLVCASFKFNCPLLPDVLPVTRVDQLKPQHIKVIMALGDSITAGRFAGGEIEELKLSSILLCFQFYLNCI